MFRNTHGNYAPGEQKNRDYDWKSNPLGQNLGYAKKKSS